MDCLVCGFLLCGIPWLEGRVLEKSVFISVLYLSNRRVKKRAEWLPVVVQKMRVGIIAKSQILNRGGHMDNALDLILSQDPLVLAGCLLFN